MVIRHNVLTIRSYCIFCLLLFCSFPLSAASFTSIKWVDLIPKNELETLLNPPESLMSIPDGSAEDVIPNSLDQAVENAIEASKAPPTPEEQAYFAALKSTNINADFSNKDIRIPGFIVPVEYSDNQVITEFFLVPYFGACIHVPPPPPNQIIYIKYPQGLKLDVLYDPFWIEGKLQTEITQNDLALAAYSITAEAVKPYTEYQK